MVGTVVSSKAGRDRGYFMVVVNAEGNFVYLCDGKKRPLERPKLKNVKHIAFTNTVLCSDSFKSNKSLKKALAVYKDTAKFKEEA